MKCTDLGPQMLEYLAGTLPDDRLAEIRAHLAECAACRDEVDATAELWNELGAAPAPRPESARMRARFDAALQGYIDGQAESRVPSRLTAAPSRLAVAAVGAVRGRGRAARDRHRPGPDAAVERRSRNPDIALLREELRDTRQMVTLSLLQQQSASERLKGVTTSSQLEQPGTEVVTALLDTLRRDPNVNVRLATVDALRRFGSREAVRKGVVDALPQQESPLVQIAMVDFILEAAGPDAAQRAAAAGGGHDAEPGSAGPRGARTAAGGAVKAAAWVVVAALAVGCAASACKASARGLVRDERRDSRRMQFSGRRRRARSTSARSTDRSSVTGDGGTDVRLEAVTRVEADDDADAAGPGSRT